MISRASRLGQKDREKFARARAKALEPKLLRTTLAVANPPEGLVLKLDGKELPSDAWGSPIPLDPGEHSLEATAPGKKPWTSSFVATAENPNRRVVVPVLEAKDIAPSNPPGIEQPGSAPQVAEATPAIAAPAVATAPPGALEPQTETTAGQASPRRSRHFRLWTGPYVAGGVGLAALGVGIYFGYEAKAKHSMATDPNQVGRQTAIASGQSNQRVANILFAVSGVAFATGFGLFAWGGPAPATVAVAPVPGGAAVTASVSLR